MRRKKNDGLCAECGVAPRRITPPGTSKQYQCCYPCDRKRRRARTPPPGSGKTGRICRMDGLCRECGIAPKHVRPSGRASYCLPCETKRSRELEHKRLGKTEVLFWCERCRKAVRTTKPGPHHFCSPCRHMLERMRERREQTAARIGPPRPCEGCGRSYTPLRVDGKTCSKICNQRWRLARNPLCYKCKLRPHLPTWSMCRECSRAAQLEYEKRRKQPKPSLELRLELRRLNREYWSRRYAIRRERERADLREYSRRLRAKNGAAGSPELEEVLYMQSKLHSEVLRQKRSREFSRTRSSYLQSKLGSTTQKVRIP